MEEIMSHLQSIVFQVSPLTVLLLALFFLAFRDWYFSKKYAECLSSEMSRSKKVELLKKSRYKDNTAEVATCFFFSFVVHALLFIIL